MTALILSVLLIFPVCAGEEKRVLPRLVDQADLLSDEEEDRLLAKLDAISERRNCDVVIVTVDSIGRSTATQYADDFYDENGYGMGAQRDGILLLLGMESRDWAISTCGYGITAFTDAGQKYMTEQFLPYLGDGEYAEAFDCFADLCEQFIEQAKSGKAYDTGTLPQKSYRGYLPLWTAGSFAAGFGIAFIMAQMKKSKLKTVRTSHAAGDYEREGSFRLTGNSDILVNRQITSRKIETESENSGGSSTHISSSGTTHGGSSGKF